ncbi:MAG: DUF2892 domain-containing protein [Thermosynechococcaceae cyanobacterium]
MSANLGIADRISRLSVSMLLIVLSQSVFPGSALGIGLAISSMFPLASGLIGFCPLYSLLKINTYQREFETQVDPYEFEDG